MDTKLQYPEFIAFPTENNTAVRIEFKDKTNIVKFSKTFKQSDFGKQAEMESSEQKRNLPQSLKTNTTFTCAVKDIPISTNVEEVKIHLKSKIPITDLSRIICDRGPELISLNFNLF